MATITIASRPVTLDGCWQTWRERDAPATLRSDMDLGGFTKTRLRTTAAAWLVDAQVTLAANLYADFQTWYRTNCVLGSLPTRVKRPDGREVVMRFTAPPAIEWPESEKNAFRVTATLEQLPAWAAL
jgi:hypothetical protein